MIEINSKNLQEIKGKLSYSSKLAEKLSAVESEVSRTNRQLKALSEIFNNEESDIKELDSFSLTTLFLKLTGKYTRKLSEEKRELLEAKANLEKCNSYLTTLLEEKSQLLKEVTYYKDLEEEYKKLLFEKEQLLNSSEHPQKKKLLKIIDEINTLSLELKDVTEALEQGSLLYSTLINLTSELEDADSILKETRLNKITSRLKIENISDYINKVKLQLSSYKVELSELDNRLQKTINLNTLDFLSDNLFDNFFADLLVESPIKEALENSRALKASIESIQSSLKEDKNDILKNISLLNAEKETILEES
ncbi:MAG: hypothetical protein ABRQ25_12910 [Clostridiaceae bacterium]